MKTTLLLAVCLAGFSASGQVGVGTTTPNAQLDVRATNAAAPTNTDGLLIPKINTFPAVNPTAVQQGMLVYLTTTVGLRTPGFYYWNFPTLSWIGLAAAGSGWLTTGNAGLASGTNFMGTTDNISVAFRSNNTERMRLLNTGNFVVNNTTANAADVFSAYATGTNFAVNGYATGMAAGGYFQNTATGPSMMGVKTGTTGPAGYFTTYITANNSPTVDIFNQTGTSAALSIRTDPASATADGIELDINGAAAKRGIDMYIDPVVSGLGVAVFHDGTNRVMNLQQQNAANTQPALFVNAAGNTARVINAQNISTTHNAQVGFFSQLSTGLGFPAYQNAASVWGQSNGIRSGIFLAGGASANTTVLEAGYSGVLGNYDGVGVYGTFAPAVGYGYGVVGEGNWYGVFSLGDTGATGLKAFQIDHPLDPENKYLKHYSMESPEVLNVYRGNVILDAHGEGTVELPSYFSSVNANYSYQLTAIGAPANVYIKQEIAGNQFKVAGGHPNQKISWQVFAERNDPYLQQNPDKRAVEVAKKVHDKGLYLQPELYRQPKSKSIFARYKSNPDRVKNETEVSKEQNRPSPQPVKAQPQFTKD